MRFPLVQGAYEARGILASAQRCENLFLEGNPKDSHFPTAHYPTAGLKAFEDYSAIESGPVRGMWWASNGALYVAVGQTVVRQYGQVGPWGTGYHVLGYLDTDSGNPVVMTDNGNDVVIVDGTVNPNGSTYDGGGNQWAGPATGWRIHLADDTFSAISSASFYGANRVDYLDTYVVANWPGTPTFYSSNSNDVSDAGWQGLYFAEKTGFSDNLASIACVHDLIWLLGEVTTEIWFNAGDVAFPFERMPNSIIQQGCRAPYSVVVSDNAIYWISQDRYGRNMLIRGEGYQARRVSNHAIESIWQDYGTISDAIGMSYQMAGHEIILFYFPTADATWGYDASTGQWHRRKYGSSDDAWLPRCIAYAPHADWDNIFAGDRTAPRLLQIDRHTYVDVDQVIRRLRSWPHLMADEKRMSHTDFTASLMPTNLVPDAVTLRWSDDGGQTFGNPVVQAAGGAGWPESYGQYSWSRLGYARSRVYELSWTSTGETALNGAWIQAQPAET